MRPRSWLPGTSRTGTPDEARRLSGASAVSASHAGTRLRYSKSPPWTTTSTSPVRAGSSARSKLWKKSSPRRRRTTRGRIGQSKPMCVSDTNSTRTSHPPERGRESSIRKRGCEAKAQCDRSPSRNQPFEFSGQHAQAIEARHREELTTGHHRTLIAGWDRRCSLWSSVSVEHDLAAFDHHQARTRGTRLAPHHARID